MFDMDEIMKRAREAEQISANQQRQVEILRQVFSPDAMAQMTANEALIRQMEDQTVSETAALGLEGMMGQLFSEDDVIACHAFDLCHFLFSRVPL